MHKMKSKCGYTVYKVTILDIFELGGVGICDECGKASMNGYLVPVLNHYQCPKCFDEWNARATYYPEDIPAEQRVAEYYEKMIPITEETEAVRSETS